jgi:hypothetical protein
MPKSVSLSAGSTLTFEMQCQQYNDAGENLGRFRLSLTGDPAALDRERKRFTISKLADPWEKLAAAYQFLGDRKALAHRETEAIPRAASLTFYFTGRCTRQESNL